MADFTRIGFSPWGTLRGVVQAVTPTQPLIANVPTNGFHRRLTFVAAEVAAVNMADVVNPWRYYAEVVLMAGDVDATVTDTGYPKNRLIYRGAVGLDSPLRLSWQRGAGPLFMQDESISLVVNLLRALSPEHGTAIDTRAYATVLGYDEADDSGAKYRAI